MDLELEGRKVLVTGASRGIGRAFAEAFAGEDCDVTIVARDQAALEATAGEIAAASGRRVEVFAADLGSGSAAAEAAVAAHLAAHGRLDVLVNNAGASRAGEFLALGDEDWRASFAIKFHGYVAMCRAAWPALREAGGIVVNNIGAAGKQPTPGFLIGASINAALNNFTKGLAQLGTADGVRVVSINSGPVRVPRVEEMLARQAADEGRPVEEVAAARTRALGMIGYARPHDLAALALFVASPRGGHIHGANLYIDGGQTKEL